jgi:hypothetical protein
MKSATGLWSTHVTQRDERAKDMLDNNNFVLEERMLELQYELFDVYNRARHVVFNNEASERKVLLHLSKSINLVYIELVRIGAKLEGTKSAEPEMYPS